MPTVLNMRPAVEQRLLQAIDKRNRTLDEIFYDVGVVKDDEKVLIDTVEITEGDLFIVPPSGQDTAVLCKSVDDFISQGGDKVPSLAISGVGSSALGAIAFARNIADATGDKVCCVVSGYGLSDVATEALGGFFCFGALNSLRHSFQQLELSNATENTEDNNDALTLGRTHAFIPCRSPDTLSVLALLRDERVRFKLMTGHSKGNLVLSEALYALKDLDKPRLKMLGLTTKIITISAVIAMPPQMKDIVDIIGSLDLLGKVNSRPSIRPDFLVPHASHHTNTARHFHLPVTKSVKHFVERDLRS